MTGEVGLKLARILAAIQPAPDQKAHGHCPATRDPTDHAGHTEGWIEAKLLAVRPGQCSRIGACVRNDTIQKHAWRSARCTELSTQQRQRRAGIAGIVRETRPTDTIPGLAFMPDTDHERMPPCLVDGEKDIQRSGCRRNHHAIRKGNPLPFVLLQKLVSNSPVGCLVLAPVRMDLPCYFRRQSIGQALHLLPRVRSAINRTRVLLCKCCIFLHQPIAQIAVRDNAHGASKNHPWTRLYSL